MPRLIILSASTPLSTKTDFIIGLWAMIPSATPKRPDSWILIRILCFNRAAWLFIKRSASKSWMINWIFTPLFLAFLTSKVVKKLWWSIGNWIRSSSPLFKRFKDWLNDLALCIWAFIILILYQLSTERTKAWYPSLFTISSTSFRALLPAFLTLLSCKNSSFK